MPQDLIEGLLGYIKGPSYFKHFLIGTIGSDSASARLSGASRYIFTIATGYESTTFYEYVQHVTQKAGGFAKARVKIISVC